LSLQESDAKRSTAKIHVVRSDLNIAGNSGLTKSSVDVRYERGRE